MAENIIPTLKRWLASARINANSSKSEEYCFHCFQNSKFLDEGITLQEKIDKNVKIAVQMGMAESEARKMASKVLPQLKRWKQ